MKEILKKVILWLMTLSLIFSHRSRKENSLKRKLSEIVPDISNQYTTFKINMNDPYMVNKIRGQHSFQVSLALQAVHMLKNHNNQINIVDIGDSSGTHLMYLETV